MVTGIGLLVVAIVATQPCWGGLCDAIVDYFIMGSFSFSPQRLVLSPGPLLECGVLALFGTIPIFFFAVVIYRSLIQPWQRIAALDLAQMLKRRNYRLWFDNLDRSKRMVCDLRTLGANDLLG